MIPLAEELLEAPKELILTALELERSEGAVIADRVGDTACTFLAGLYRAEQAIADRLIRVANGKLPSVLIDEAKAIPWVEKRSGHAIAPQEENGLPCDHDGRAGAGHRPLHGSHGSGEALHHPRQERGREERRQ